MIYAFEAAASQDTPDYSLIKQFNTVMNPSVAPELFHIDAYYINGNQSIYGFIDDLFHRINEQNQKDKLREEVKTLLEKAGKEKDEIDGLLDKDIRTQFEKTGKISQPSEQATKYAKARIGKIEKLDTQEIGILLIYALEAAASQNTPDYSLINQFNTVMNPSVALELFHIDAYYINGNQSIYGFIDNLFDRISDDQQKKKLRQQVETFLENVGKEKAEIDGILHPPTRKQFHMQHMKEYFLNHPQETTIQYVQARIKRICDGKYIPKREKRLIAIYAIVLGVKNNNWFILDELVAKATTHSKLLEEIDMSFFYKKIVKIRRQEKNNKPRFHYATLHDYIKNSMLISLKVRNREKTILEKISSFAVLIGYKEDSTKKLLDIDYDLELVGFPQEDIRVHKENPTRFCGPYRLGSEKKTIDVTEELIEKDKCIKKVIRENDTQKLNKIIAEIQKDTNIQKAYDVLLFIGRGGKEKKEKKYALAVTLVKQKSILHYDKKNKKTDLVYLDHYLTQKGFSNAATIIRKLRNKFDNTKKNL